AAHLRQPVFTEESEQLRTGCRSRHSVASRNLSKANILQCGSQRWRMLQTPRQGDCIVFQAYTLLRVAEEPPQQRPSRQSADGRIVVEIQEAMYRMAGLIVKGQSGVYMHACICEYSAQQPSWPCGMVC